MPRLTDDPIPPPTPQKRRRGLWLPIGEVVGVLALVIAGLNFWQAHQQYQTAQKAAQTQAQARSAFVMTGAANRAGDRIDFHPLNPDQAIQSQTYIFPDALADRPIKLAATPPRLERSWIEKGLRAALAGEHAPGSGEGLAPLAVVTTYVQDGETYTDDGSLYQVGYAWRSTLLGGRKITLEGVSLAQRGVKGAQAAAEVNRRWRADHPPKAAPAPTPAPPRPAQEDPAGAGPGG
jgi:hypothetical protein